MSTTDELNDFVNWAQAGLIILIFALGFALGYAHCKHVNKAVLTVSGETWDSCESPDLVIHEDGHGKKMLRCWKDVTVDPKSMK